MLPLTTYLLIRIAAEEFEALSGDSIEAILARKQIEMF